MKKQIAVIITAAILTATPALADQFLDDFNAYAEGLYGIPLLEPVFENLSYKSADVEIMHLGEISIYGRNPLSVISAACCALRAIDNSGSMLDQYGKVMHVYFLHNVRKTEARATTESGILVYFSEDKGLFTIRLVR